MKIIIPESLLLDLDKYIETKLANELSRRKNKEHQMIFRDYCMINNSTNRKQSMEEYKNTHKLNSIDTVRKRLKAFEKTLPPSMTRKKPIDPDKT